MTKLKPYNIHSIAKSVEQVLKTNDIEKLTKQAYDFINQQPGFIAHYNHAGFKDYYGEVSTLADDIIASCASTDPGYWMEDYFINQYGFDYCYSKTETMRKLRALADDHKRSFTVYRVPFDYQISGVVNVMAKSEKEAQANLQDYLNIEGLPATFDTVERNFSAGEPLKNN